MNTQAAPRRSVVAATGSRDAIIFENLEGRQLLSAAAYPTQAEQYLVELINRARLDPLGEAARYGMNLNEGLAGGTISSSPKQALAINPIMVATARGQAQWLIDSDQITHTGPDGSQSYNRVPAAGYPMVWPYKVSENVAVSGASNPTAQVDELHRILFVDTVVSSRGHRVTIMDPVLEEMGTGIASGPFRNYNGTAGTEDFAFSSYLGGKAFLTGVAYSDSVNRNSFYTIGEGLGGVTVSARRTSDGLTAGATTWGSGGYSLALYPGTYTVTATGGALGGTVVYDNVVVGADNVKRDFTPAQAGGGTPVDPPPPTPTEPTPYRGSAFNVGETIQAEDFDNGGEGVAYHDVTSNNQGGKYRTMGVDVESTGDAGGGYAVAYTKSGEWLGYSLNVASGATYALDVRVASSGAGGAFHVEVDGQNVTGAMSVPNTGSWQGWATVNRAGINLTAGAHRVKVVMDGQGASGFTGNFNWLKFSAGAPTTPVPAPGPFSGTPIALPGTIEAENFDNGGEGQGFHDLDGANSGGKYRATGVDVESTADAGGGYAVAYTKAGEWLKYSVNVAMAGTYALDARVASNGAGGKFHIEVDGVNVTGSLAVASTGGWQNWQTVSKAGVTLSAGAHAIKLVFEANGATGFVGNFNWLAIR